MCIWPVVMKIVLSKRQISAEKCVIKFKFDKENFWRKQDLKILFGVKEIYGISTKFQKGKIFFVTFSSLLFLL